MISVQRSVFNYTALQLTILVARAYGTRWGIDRFKKSEQKTGDSESLLTLEPAAGAKCLNSLKFAELLYVNIAQTCHKGHTFPHKCIFPLWHLFLPP